MYKLFGYSTEESAEAAQACKPIPDPPGSPATTLGYSMCADAGDFKTEQQQKERATMDEGIAPTLDGVTHEPVVMACHSPRAMAGEAEAVAVIEAEKESMVQAAELAAARADAKTKATALEAALRENENLKQKLNSMHELVSGALQEVIDEAHRITPRSSSAEEDHNNNDDDKDAAADDDDDDDDDDDKDAAGTPSSTENSRLMVAWSSLGRSLGRPYSIFGIGMGLGMSGAAYKILSTPQQPRATTRKLKLSTAATATTATSALAMARSWLTQRSRFGRIFAATAATATLAAITCASLRWRRGQPILAGGIVLPVHCRNALIALRRILPRQLQQLTFLGGGKGQNASASAVTSAGNTAAEVATTTAKSLEATLSDFGEYIKNAKPETHPDMH